MERLLGVVILLEVGRKLRMPHGVWIRNGYQLWQIKFWIKYVLTILTANVRGIVLLLAVPKLNIAELRLTDVLPKEYKEMLLRAVRDAESDISGLEGDTPILALFPVRFTTN